MGEALQLDTNEYKLGTTKVFFKAGVLGTLEEMRDERLGKIIAMFQANIRGYLMRKNYKHLMDQRTALSVIQKNIRKWLGLKNWLWWRLFVKAKPLLAVAAQEDEMKVKEEELVKTKEALEKTEKKLKEYEEQNVELYQAKQDLAIEVQSAQDKFDEYEENASADMAEKKKKMDAEIKALKEDVEDLEAALGKAEKEKADKDDEIKNLEDDNANKDDSIAKLSKDKKNLEDEGKNLMEALQAEEDKVN